MIKKIFKYVILFVIVLCIGLALSFVDYEPARDYTDITYICQEKK